MTPLPAKLEPGAPLVAWRVDAQRHASSWDSGIGAEAVGGRWNPIQTWSLRVISLKLSGVLFPPIRALDHRKLPWASVAVGKGHFAVFQALVKPTKFDLWN